MEKTLTACQGGAWYPEVKAQAQVKADDLLGKVIATPLQCDVKSGDVGVVTWIEQAGAVVTLGDDVAVITVAAPPPAALIATTAAPADSPGAPAAPKPAPSKKGKSSKSHRTGKA